MEAFDDIRWVGTSSFGLSTSHRFNIAFIVVVMCMAWAVIALTAVPSTAWWVATHVAILSALAIPFGLTALSPQTKFQVKKKSGRNVLPLLLPP